MAAFALAVCPALFLSPNAQAGRLSGPEGHGGQISLDRAVEQVRQSTGGRILGAETVDRGGKVVYRIKVLTRDGQVRYVYVEAERRR
jgi:uncharacterized membrane protein YkoI